jgi:hypothetical protein
VIAEIATIITAGNIQVISIPIPRKMAERAGTLDLKFMQFTPFLSARLFSI